MMNLLRKPVLEGLVSAEGTAISAVKPWSSFQCTGIHHAVRARTYKGDEHLAYALNKSMAPLVTSHFAKSHFANTVVVRG